MKILISGGTGLIGSALTELLAADGHQITILTRSPEKYAGQLPAGVTAAGWDAKTQKGLGEWIEWADAVINLAGESTSGDSILAVLTDRWTQAKKDRIITSRVNVGQALAEAILAAEKKPSVLIQASAMGYYSPSGTEPLTESSPVGSDFSAHICATWEASTAGVEDAGLRRVIIRTGLVFTRQGGIMGIMLLPFRLFVGGYLGSGLQPIAWIHIRDEIGAIRFLLMNETARGAYNLAAPDSVNYRQFAVTAGKVLRRPNWFNLPAWLLKAVLGEKASIVLEMQDIRPERLLAAGYEFQFTDLQAALVDLTT
jgi:uncharacterized protein (TIGR01777 family)